MTPAQRSAIIAMADANGGKITPAELVTEATSVASVLHDLLPWDDASAAHQHRLDVARRVLRSMVELIEHPSQPIMIRAPYVLRDPNLPAQESGYITSVALRDDVTASREAVKRELARVQSALERAVRVAAALGLLGELETLLEQTTALQTKLDSAA